MRCENQDKSQDKSKVNDCESEEYFKSDRQLCKTETADVAVFADIRSFCDDFSDCRFSCILTCRGTGESVLNKDFAYK
ncbi:MAG: hypothetical protein ACK556_13630 [Pseudanabaena sp.]